MDESVNWKTLKRKTEKKIDIFCQFNTCWHKIFKHTLWKENTFELLLIHFGKEIFFQSLFARQFIVKIQQKKFLYVYGQSSYWMVVTVNLIRVTVDWTSVTEAWMTFEIYVFCSSIWTIQQYIRHTVKRSKWDSIKI